MAVPSRKETTRSDYGSSSASIPEHKDHGASFLDGFTPPSERKTVTSTTSERAYLRSDDDSGFGSIDSGYGSMPVASAVSSSIEPYYQYYQETAIPQHLPRTRNSLRYSELLGSSSNESSPANLCEPSVDTWTPSEPALREDFERGTVCSEESTVSPRSDMKEFELALARDLQRRLLPFPGDDSAFLQKILPSRLAEFARRLAAEGSSQIYRDIMVFVHKHRRQVLIQSQVEAKHVRRDAYISSNGNM